MCILLLGPPETAVKPRPGTACWSPRVHDSFLLSIADVSVLIKQAKITLLPTCQTAGALQINTSQQAGKKAAQLLSEPWASSWSSRANG